MYVPCLLVRPLPTPIDPLTLRETEEGIAPQTLQRITKTSAVEALLKIACKREEFSPKTL